MLLHRSGTVVLAALLAIACAACQSKTASKEENEPKSGKLLIEEDAIIRGSKSESDETPVKETPQAVKKRIEQPVPPLIIPKVSLSGELRAACLVDVGDIFPEAKLPDLSGKLHALDSLYGQKLTVVCFWTIGSSRRSQMTADALLRDLTSEIAAPYADHGVGVVAVNVADDPSAVDQFVGQTGAELPCLLDPQAEYFARIAKDQRMPRIFLLDANGRILWFDIEYSRPSRRELLQCIHVALEKL